MLFFSVTAEANILHETTEDMFVIICTPNLMQELLSVKVVHPGIVCFVLWCKLSVWPANFFSFSVFFNIDNMISLTISSSSPL